ncbi:hypothetical protein ACFW16_30715 [Inquilinus sp. NPDC058860]|uniref:hypothetical protein n=1 Tax=Inquilinus sp. NPDC058860 TaxID=3346652 RepID=UPI003698AE54
MKKIIFVEANEIPFRVFDRYIEQNPTGFLAKFLSECVQYETICEDEQQLDPWISWPTMHRGTTDRNHGILHLGQPIAPEVEKDYPPIWEWLRLANRSVGVFGSLHSSAIPTRMQDYAFYLPDYFAADAAAWPPELETFQRFNLVMTRNSARNVSMGFGPASALGGFLGKVAPKLSMNTAGQILGFLVEERFKPYKRIRRRSFQPVIMADLFLHNLERTKPDFATFYTNHVAAAMHRYWAAQFPEDYREQVEVDWIGKYKGEISFAMAKLEGIIRKFMKFVERNPEYGIVMASSLGQAAIRFGRTDEFLTIVSVEKLMDALGVDRAHWASAPAMVPCVSIRMQGNHPSRDEIQSKLENIRIGDHRMVCSPRPDKPLCFDIKDDYIHVYVSIDNYKGDNFAFHGNQKIPFEDIGFGMMAHEDNVNCTAQHVRGGTLFIHQPGEARPISPGTARTQISTIDFVPSLLGHYGIDAGGRFAGKPSIQF